MATDSRSISVRPDPLYHVVWLSLSVVVLMAAVLLSIRGSSEVIVPAIGYPLPELCMMKRTTGLVCPGCGLTRCFISLAHGDVASAWSYNPAGLWLFAIVGLQVPFRGYQLWRIRHGLPELVLTRLGLAVFLVFAVALLAQWTLRLAGVSF
jgi:hypothetical protein